MNHKSILIIENPISGNGRKRALLLRVISLLESAGAAVELYTTQAAGDAVKFLLSYQGNANVVVAAGGDGTINEVINGLLHKNIPLGVIPTGTTNVLAKELGLSKSAKALAEVILNGVEKPVFLGLLNGKRFSMMIGVGYDAWVVNNVNLKIKKSFGKLAYIISMFKELATFGKQVFDVDIDGVKLRASSLIITQGKYYAGSFVLSRRADLSKDDIQALVITTRSRLKFLFTIFALPLGLMELMPSVSSISAKKIKISTREPIMQLDVLQADGDPAGLMPAEISLEDKSVSMLVPL